MTSLPDASRSFAPRPSTFSTASTFSRSRNVTLLRRSRYWKASPISSSSQGRMRSRWSTTVTFAPSSPNIDAYSTPITPAPTTVIVRGTRLSSLSSPSESMIVRSSNCTESGRAGRVPTAITMFFARTCSSIPWMSTVCGSTNVASPGSRPTRLRRNCSRVIAVSAATTAPARSSSCWMASRSVSSTRVGSSTSSGRVASCSSTAWRSVLDGIVPVWIETPPRRSRRSATATWRPSLAAWIAARWPPGPDPITRRSSSTGVESSGVFDSLSEKLQGTLAGVRQRGALTEDDVNKAMREIRLALLEADVNFKVVKQFTSTVKERALGIEVLKQLNPGQQVVKIVNEELTALMGGQSAGITFSPRPPTVILMAGLQGSGKTTATAKLAKLLREQNGSSVAVAACDVYRPAAVEQLVKVGTQAGAAVYEQGTDRDPVEIAGWALDQATRDGKDVLIVDTSGRLHIDQELMAELANIKKRVQPHAVLLVVDAMPGQDAVNVAEQFAEVAQFDGVVLSKLDGDARGGAALSVKAVTGKPIMYASTGEKLGDFEKFHPDRMAQRILGMGDVLSFIEKAEQSVDEEESKELEKKIRKEEFTLDDFLQQMQQVRNMGPLGNLLKMMPGVGSQLGSLQVDEKELDRLEAIIRSMTPEERANPKIIDGSRRRRIARGSGTNVQAVSHLVKQFGQMRKVMKQVASGKMPSLQQLAGGGR